MEYFGIVLFLLLYKYCKGSEYYVHHWLEWQVIEENSYFDNIWKKNSTYALYGFGCWLDHLTELNLCFVKQI